ncbi:Alpha/Beta hydrolase protein [Mycena sanguinolenta]|nr:Alpha/Beta hydrolase protein [Mycena sanguinolenta]
MSQYVHLSDPGPELPDIPRNTSTEPLSANYMPTLREMMSVTANAQNAKRLPPDSTYTLRDRTIAVDGAEIAIPMISPTPLPNEEAESQSWSGWAAGDLNTNDFTLRMLSVELRLAIINVDYRLAPQFPFPAGLNDCYAALKWTVDNCKSIHGSLNKGFIVGGVDPCFEKYKLIGHLLQSPALVHPAAYPAESVPELLSFKQNADAPILSQAATDLFYDCLAEPPTNPEVSPLLADHTCVPPAYIQVCGLDPLRDEGLLYERLLREQGVPTRLDMCTYLVPS